MTVDMSAFGIEYVLNTLTTQVTGSQVITGALVLIAVYLMCTVLNLEFIDTAILLVITTFGLFLHSLINGGIVVMALIFVIYLFYAAYKAITER